MDTCVRVDLGVTCWAEVGGWFRDGDGGALVGRGRSAG